MSSKHIEVVFSFDAETHAEASKILEELLSAAVEETAQFDYLIVDGAGVEDPDAWETLDGQNVWEEES